MSEAPLGKWVIVRSDRSVISIDKADHVYHIGRGRQLPAPQQLSHAYVSREHLAVVWHPPHLYVAQTGKNPTFIGTACDAVPRLTAGQPNASAADETTASTALSAADVPQRAQLLFTPSATATEATLEKSASGALTVSVPLADPLTVTRAPDSLTVTGSTLYFPEELRMPSLTVRFESGEVNREGATAAATTKTAAEMLAVPAFGTVHDDDSEDEDELSDGEHPPIVTKSDAVSAGAPGNAEAEEGEERPEWRGRLDVAMHEQQRQDAAAAATARLSAGQRAEKTEAQATPAVAAAAPSTTAVPFGGASSTKEKGDSTTAAAERPQSPPAPPQQSQQHQHQQHMGFWEWNCHANGNVDDPKSWRKYNRAVAELLEKSYRDPKVAKIKIPDSAMFDKPGAKGFTYGVCFAEKALNGAMIQYSLDNPGKFRVIRRTGGTPVDRKKAKKAHVIPSSSSESESEDSTSDDYSDSEESISSSSSSSSDSDEEPQKKRRCR